MPVVPFTMESGLSQVSGVVREDENGIAIEYESKLLGLIRSDIQTIHIPFEEIEEVFFSSNFFSTKLRINLKTLRHIGKFPAPKQGELELKISRKNRTQAKALASSVNLSVSEFELYRGEDDEWV
jgi:hypothetical protein